MYASCSSKYTIVDLCVTCTDGSPIENGHVGVEVMLFIAHVPIMSKEVTRPSLWPKSLL